MYFYRTVWTIKQKKQKQTEVQIKCTYITVKLSCELASNRNLVLSRMNIKCHFHQSPVSHHSVTSHPLQHPKSKTRRQLFSSQYCKYHILTFQKVWDASGLYNYGTAGEGERSGVILPLRVSNRYCF